MNTLHPDAWYTPGQIAKSGFLLGYKPNFIRKLIQDGKLPAKNKAEKSGRKSWAIKGSDITTYINNLG